MKKLHGIMLSLCLIGSLVGCTSAKTSKVEQIKPTVESQSIGLTGVENARDIGGYVGADGKTIKKGKLLRTGKLVKATEDDIKKLKDSYNLKEIIDFRTSDEITNDPDPKIDTVNRKELKILNEDSIPKGPVGNSDPVKGMIDIVNSGFVNENMYVDMCNSEQGKKGYSEFFKELLNNKDGAVLWHCTAGKDRAGIATSLLLSTLGVDRETVLNDFDLSNDFYKKNIDYMVAGASKYTDNQETIKGVKALVGVDRSYMEKFLDNIDKNYGSVDNYLQKELGLSKNDIKKLKTLYLE